MNTVANFGAGVPRISAFWSAVLAWCALVFITAPWGPIKFDNSVCQYFQSELFYLAPLPWAVAAFVGVLRSRTKLWIAVVSLLPVVFCAVAFTLLFVFHTFYFSAMLSTDEIAKCIKRVDVGQHHIEVIRENLAAFRPWNLEIREVWPILPGVKFVKIIDYIPRKDKAEVVVLDRHSFVLAGVKAYNLD